MSWMIHATGTLPALREQIEISAQMPPSFKKAALAALDFELPKGCAVELETAGHFLSFTGQASDAQLLSGEGGFKIRIVKILGSEERR
ncbi:MAG: hypothetical protein ACE145_20935 [Terriglobia bacterium]